MKKFKIIKIILGITLAITTLFNSNVFSVHSEDVTISNEGTYADLLITMAKEESVYDATIQLVGYTQYGDPTTIESSVTTAVSITSSSGDKTTSDVVFTSTWDDKLQASPLTATIKGVAPSSDITVHDIYISGQYNSYTQIASTNAWVSATSNDDSLVVETKEITLKSGDNSLTLLAKKDDTVYTQPTDDTFTSIGGKYDIAYLLNAYNIVSFEDVEGQHIIGPIIAQDSAYRTSDATLPGYTGDTASGDNGSTDDVLVYSDYAKGVSSYVGTLLARVSDESLPGSVLNYAYDTYYGSGPYPTLYTSLSNQQIKTELINSEHIEYILNANSKFISPNASGKAETLQSDTFINFTTLYNTVYEESKSLASTGTLEDYPVSVIVLSDALVSIEVEAGKSYIIEDASKLESINIILPEGYDTYSNPYPEATVISITDTNLKQGNIGGMVHSIFPMIYVNGKAIDANEGYDGEYGEKGNKIIFNIPNVTTQENGTNRISFAGSGQNIPGHIIAPNAEIWNYQQTGATVSWVGGNINGSIICKSFHAGEAEIHLFPYTGSERESVVLSANKTLVNDKLSNGEFSFILEEYGTNPTGLLNTDLAYTVTNDADGNIVFPALVFSAAGTYHFTMSEVIPSGSDKDIYMDYDESVYLVKVTVTSSGTTMDSSVVITKIVDHNGQEVEESVNSADFVNTATDNIIIKTDFEVEKQDQFGDAVVDATFTLKEIISVLDHTVVEDGLSLTTTSDETGYVYFHNLEAGKVYLLNESSAPEGYILGEGYWVLSVDDKGVITVYRYDNAEDITDGIITNTKLVYVDYSFTKKNVAEIELEDAIFTLIEVDNIDAYGNYTIVTNGEVQTITSNKDGLVKFEDLKAGTSYKLYETKAPDGYVLETGYWILTISNEGTITVKNYDGADSLYEGVVINYAEVLYTDFVFGKVNESNEALEGATFKLEEINSLEDMSVVIDGYNETTTSDQLGKVIFKDLQIGKYYKLSETMAPEGYDLEEGYWVLEVTDSGIVTHAMNAESLSDGYITNTKTEIKTTDYEFSKVDDNGNGLEGATFTAVEVDSTTFNEIVDGHSIKYTSGYYGSVVLKGLMYNTTYKVYESQTPEGYSKVNEDEFWILTINNEGNVSVTYYKNQNTSGSNVTGDLFITNEKNIIYTDFTIYKENTNGLRLEGAIFTISEVELNELGSYDLVDGGIVQTITSSSTGIVRFEGLVSEKTYLLEETQAPDKYDAIEGYWIITIDDKGNITTTNEDGAPSLGVSSVVVNTKSEIITSYTFTKQDNYGVTLEGVVFYIEEITSLENPTLVTDGYNAIITSDASGSVRIENLVSNTYYAIYEYDALPGYVQESGYWVIYVNEDGIIEKHSVGTADDLNDDILVNVKKPSVSFEFSKVNQFGSYLEHVQFTLVEVELNAENEYVNVEGGYSSIVNSDYKGNVKFSDIGYEKTYRLVESKILDGYEEVSGYWIITSDTNGVITSVAYDGAIEFDDNTIENTQIITSFEFNKVDEESTGLQGATFQLDEVTSATNHTVVNKGLSLTITSDETGTVSFSGLVAGSSYKLYELEAPVGYDAIVGYWIVSVDYDGNISVTSYANAPTLDAINGTVLNYVTITETDYTFKKVGEGDDEEALAGATFSLVEVNSLNVEDHIDDESNTVYVTSDANGNVTFEDLTFNSFYMLKETKAPDGYDLERGYWVLEVTSEGVYAHAFENAESLSNGEIKNTLTYVEVFYEFEFHKQDQDGNALEGATFVAEKVEYKDGEYVVVEGENAYSFTKVSDYTGQVLIEGLQINCIYKLYESAAPDGYVKEEGYWILTVDNDGIVHVSEKDNAEDLDDLIVTNTKETVYVDVTMYKYNNQREGLAGAIFTLQEVEWSNSHEPVEDAPILEVTSDENGVISFTNLEAGKRYKLIEASAPEGYDAVEGYWLIKVDEDGNITTEAYGDAEDLNTNNFIVYNDRSVFEVDYELIKVDVDGNALKDAEFSITQVVSLDNETQVNGTTTKYVTSGENGLLLFEGLKTSSYYKIVEESAPLGYHKEEGYWIIEIDEEGNIEPHAFNNAQCIHVEDDTYIGSEGQSIADVINTGDGVESLFDLRFMFRKHNQDNEPLEYATFSLVEVTLNEDGEYVVVEDGYNKTSSSGYLGHVIFDEIGYKRSYMLTEIEAPAHYGLATGYWILTTDEYGLMSVTAYDGAQSLDDRIVINTLLTENDDYELPLTGGMGTNYVYGIGLLFILSSFVGLKRKRG